MSGESTEAELKARRDLLRRRDSVAQTIVQVARQHLGQFQPQLVRLQYLDQTKRYSVSGGAR